VCELVGEAARDRHGPSLVVLRRAHDDMTVDLRGWFDDFDPSPQQVNSAHGQRSQLAQRRPA
jgi:hypothetical protein